MNDEGQTEPEETRYWLEHLVAAEIAPAPRLGPLPDETSQDTAVFITTSKKLESRS